MFFFLLHTQWSNYIYSDLFAHGRSVCHCSDNSQVFQREVLRSRRNSTTVVNRPNMVPDFFIKHMVTQIMCVNDYALNVLFSTSSSAGPILTYSCAQHQASSDQTSKRRVFGNVWCLKGACQTTVSLSSHRERWCLQKNMREQQVVESSGPSIL